QDCELRCGSRYTLLRDEFLKEKKKLKHKKFKIQHSKFNIFIAMGGADHSNINIDILKTIKKVNRISKNIIKVNLVTTTANKNLKKLEKYCQNKSWINLHINSNKIAKLMSKSDLAIVTPSVTVNEVYFLDLPMIAIKTADNQIDMYKYLKKKRLMVLKEFSQYKLEKRLQKMIKGI
ncbi:MAG: UDP-2,4-diacetamido-2,4,6-trideoxy-beta-L-altropyranose hydrolase, partial [Campylobacterota bacterium]